MTDTQAATSQPPAPRAEAPPPKPTPGTPATPTPAPAGPAKDRWAPLFAVSIGLVIAFAVMIAVMMVLADGSTDAVWIRRIALLGSAEAIVFTAVGWLFGREVHRSEAQSAKNDAQKAKDDAGKATEEAKQANRDAAAQSAEASAERAKGAAVKAVVRAGMAGGGGQQPVDGAAPVGLNPAGPPDAMLQLVNEFWPD